MKVIKIIDHELFSYYGADTNEWLKFLKDNQLIMHKKGNTAEIIVEKTTVKMIKNKKEWKKLIRRKWVKYAEVMTLKNFPEYTMILFKPDENPLEIMLSIAGKLKHYEINYRDLGHEHSWTVWTKDGIFVAHVFKQK